MIVVEPLHNIKTVINYKKFYFPLILLEIYHVVGEVFFFASFPLLASCLKCTFSIYVLVNDWVKKTNTNIIEFNFIENVSYSYTRNNWQFSFHIVFILLPSFRMLRKCWNVFGYIYVSMILINFHVWWTLILNFNIGFRTSHR